ncbi:MULTISPECIES: hypothetical protein [unclassified Pseudomonas]|jgi:hypothetical protein|uniref:hypothetical protein n=1 Tax=unclassified Pseudomonas TaxID=196821 RepID=UPI002A35A040|nr:MULTISPECIES: hypothetical protein [unclassified Pseudomonas]MDX9674131.1 hypothetical protein [Pseudomonas sp. P8_250]WPN37348.1 hypothetical protein QMK53_06805 [Pseudomonas sp. P8_139]WPN40850.1 hypothetical protein QMK55_24570 [Pseudomonas sp. P8_229]
MADPPSHHRALGQGIFDQYHCESVNGSAPMSVRQLESCRIAIIELKVLRQLYGDVKLYFGLKCPVRDIAEPLRVNSIFAGDGRSFELASQLKCDRRLISGLDSGFDNVEL